MFPTTSRNIALISPMRQRFNALSGASSFAEKIIEKYSKTEPFPFSGEALVFLKALGDKLKEEEAVRDNVSYTLKLLIVHRLLVDGKIADPTAAKSLVESVKQSISQNISYLRKTDNNAYLRMIDARSYINSAADLGEIIRTENISEKDREYIYLFVDTQILNDRFFGSDSKSYAYSGVYNHMPAHDLIYKIEKAAEGTERIGDLLLSDVTENVVNVGDTNYKYENESLTYKTENNVSENTEVGGEQTVENYAGDSSQVSNTVINAGETNQVSNTVVNAGDENYRYENENLTYKTENNVSENTEVGGIREGNGVISQTDIVHGTAKEEKVSDLAEIGLLTMNSFLSSGAGHLSSVREKYIHKLVTLSRLTAAKSDTDNAKASAERSTVISLPSAVDRLLDEKRELTEEERRIYDAVIRKVYLENHESNELVSAEEMLEKLSVAERTKALSLIINRFANDVRSGSAAHRAETADTASVLGDNSNTSVAKNISEHHMVKGNVINNNESHMVTGGTINNNEYRLVNGDVINNSEYSSATERIRSAIVNVISYINREKSSMPDAEQFGLRPASVEMKLLTFLSGKKGSEVKDFINDPEMYNDLSLQLGQLYFRITDSSVQQKILLDRVKKAADIKVSALLSEHLRQNGQKTFDRGNSYYNVSEENKRSNTYNVSETNNYNDTQNVSGSSIINNEYGTVNKTDIHNSGMPFIRNADAEKSSDNKKSVFNDLHNEYANVTENEYSTVNKTDLLNSGIPNIKGAAYEKSSAEKHSDNSKADVRSTVYVPKVQRLADRLNTVTNLLERIADKQSAYADASGRQNTGRDKTKENALAAGGVDSVYGDTSNSFVFNNTFNAYTLGSRTPENNENTIGGSASDRSTLATNITLLPIFGYEKMILPEKTQRVLLSGKRAADRMHILPMRNDIIKNRSINIINNKVLTAQGSKAVNTSGEEGAAEAADMQMPQAEHQSVALRYRDNAAGAAVNEHNSNAPQQPSQAELIKQFGNLIEGADAGLTPSFNVGTHGMSEAMAAIEQTAEKVQMNSKLIEEIREKQRMIEEVTLKSSDMDAISDEMIRKLRSQLRLDKSRFAQ